MINSSKKISEAELAEIIGKIWSGMFNTDIEDAGADFFSLGGTSLDAVRFISALRRISGISTDVQTVFDHPTLSELAAELSGAVISYAEEDILPEPDKIYEPFGLTDVQYAYWIGRSSSAELGGIPTHCYIETNSVTSDIAALENALNRLIAYQPMLRCRISDNGTQQIMESVPYRNIPCTDCISEDSFNEGIAALRKEMEGGKVLFSGLTFDVRACRFGDRVNLHFLFDAVIFDGRSIFIFLSSLFSLAQSPEKIPDRCDITFRDVATAVAKSKDSEKYNIDREKTLDRLSCLKKLPQFEIESGADKPHHISHHRITFGKDEWERFRSICLRKGITPNSALMELYAEMIAIWSNSCEFTLNLTTFDRSSEKYQTELSGMIGDFTKLILVPVKLGNGSSFVSRVKELMRETARGMDHASFGTIETERAIAKEGGLRSFSFPVVFTGMTDVSGDLDIPVDISYFTTETSQVWLDMQVIGINGGLEVHFDTAEELFPYSFVESMLMAYEKAFAELISDECLWDKEGGLTVRTRKFTERIRYNSVTAPLTDDTLTGFFMNSLLRTPDAPAVLSEKKSYTYRELYEAALPAAAELAEHEGKYAAVMIPKGADQIVGAIAVLLAGKAYIPLDCHNPVSRRKSILLGAGTDIVITLSELENEARSCGADRLVFIDKVKESAVDITPNTSPDEPAYVIFTSGSTGVPKGVEITHRSAVNTILDVNKRFGVTSEDRAIALSNLNFDLSVFDIFGMFAAGGAVVALEMSDVRDPQRWTQLGEQFGVSVWNTVPAFMQMMLEYSAAHGNGILDRLRLVMMSGDKIPPSVPEKLKAVSPEMTVVCLGGATEASIWSNYYIADRIKREWNMMPYGYPLTNQRYYVLSSLMTDCPDYVKGRLYIGGSGLAVGYIGDEKKTNEKFIIHPVTGERLYDTGDNGRYWEDGTIEFIGRDDHQVKLNGMRVELGEIEGAFSELAESCAAVVFSTGAGKSRIGIMIKPKAGMPCSEEAYIKAAAEKLPSYMVPAAVIFAEKIPLTDNGKIDRKAVSSAIEDSKASVHTAAEKKALSESEQIVAQIWCELLGEEDYTAEDDFFESGGDSLLMIKFLNIYNEKTGKNVTPDVFFGNSTIGAVADIGA